MPKETPVHCRICKREIYRSEGIEGQDWFMRKKNWYFHCECYQKWAKETGSITSAALDEEMWKDATYQYLRYKVRMDVNFSKFDHQWKMLLKKNRTPKGIFFCTKYAYDVKHLDPEKAEGGIGIVGYIYTESCTYWAQREYKEQGILNQIEKQIRQAAAQEVIVVHKKKNEPKRKQIDLAAIAEMEDD